MLPHSSVVSGFSRTIDSRTSAGVTLAVPERSNATPSIASDGAFVAVAWGASLASGATDIFLATSRDGGRTFAAPVRVNDKDGDARVNGEQPPRVVLQDADPPIVTVVWTTKGEQGTRLVFARSDDAGRSFTRATTVPGGDAAGNRGWEAVAVSRGAKASAERPLVAWLDHRELAAQDSPEKSMATMHHQHSGAKPDGVAMARKSKLSLAALDGSTAPQAVTGGVCYCCKTALAIGTDGSVHAAWRHVYPGNIRDIAFTISRDGGRSFAPPFASAKTSGSSKGVPTMDRRWRLTRTIGSTSCGRRSSAKQAPRPSRCSTHRQSTDAASPCGSGSRPKACRIIRRSRSRRTARSRSPGTSSPAVRAASRSRARR
jgi:hypothetical protein